MRAQWVGRDFTIGRKLGGGNFGTVFEARIQESGVEKLMRSFRGRGRRLGPEVSFDACMRVKDVENIIGSFRGRGRRM
jgi:hypothetical protein